MDVSTLTTADGANLAVQRSGSGRPLLLLPGQANSHDWWTDLRRSFEDTWSTITFDYRGTGTTDAAETAWSTRSFAADAAAVLDGLGIGRADVYGTSMGGRVAQWLAIDRTDLVASLVLAGTTPGGPEAIDRGPTVRSALADPDPVARREAMIDFFYTPAWRDRGVRSHLFGDPTMTARARNLHLRASNRHDASARLHEIDLPVLVLHGADDPMVPVANAELLVDHLAETDLIVTPPGDTGSSTSSPPTSPRRYATSSPDRSVVRHGVAAQTRRHQDLLGRDRDDHPARIRSRFAVAAGVEPFGQPDRVGVALDLGPAGDAEPLRAGDLRDRGPRVAVDVQHLLAVVERDHPHNPLVHGESDGHGVDQARRTDGGERRQFAGGHEGAGLVGQVVERIHADIMADRRTHEDPAVARSSWVFASARAGGAAGNRTRVLWR